MARLPRIGYKHHLRDYFITSGDKLVVEPSLLRMLCSDVVGIAKELWHGRAALLDDHFITDYEQYINCISL